MTSEAISGSALETVPNVTGSARYLSVHAGKGESRKLGVIEFRALPLFHAVAGFAGAGQFRGDVIERPRLLEIALMATGAFRAQPDKHTAGGSTMTGFARNRRMRPQ
jgi:hypothetical protein